jgi:hypothetical protein
MLSLHFVRQKEPLNSAESSQAVPFEIVYISDIKEGGTQFKI